MRSDLRVELPDGTLVGYAEAGDLSGPPVMYLHGSPSSRLEVGSPGTGPEPGRELVAGRVQGEADAARP